VSYCSTTEDLLNYRFVGAVARDEGEFVLSGILGVEAIDATVLLSGAEIPLEVVDGAISARSRSYPSAVSWTDGNGGRHTQTFATSGQ
jgi:hypothetical protein